MSLRAAIPASDIGLPQAPPEPGEKCLIVETNVAHCHIRGDNSMDENVAGMW